MCCLPLGKGSMKPAHHVRFADARPQGNDSPAKAVSQSFPSHVSRLLMTVAWNRHQRKVSHVALAGPTPLSAAPGNLFWRK
jgi:hypothetical protein